MLAIFSSILLTSTKNDCAMSQKHNMIQVLLSLRTGVLPLPAHTHLASMLLTQHALSVLACLVFPRLHEIRVCDITQSVLRAAFGFCCTSIKYFDPTQFVMSDRSASADSSAVVCTPCGDDDGPLMCCWCLRPFSDPHPCPKSLQKKPDATRPRTEILTPPPVW